MSSENLEKNQDVWLRLGKRLKEARDKAGFNQTDLAELIGAYGSDISDWERGKRPPGTAYVIAIAESLDVSLDWLLRGKDIRTNDVDHYVAALSEILKVALDQFASVHGEAIRRKKENEESE